MGAHSEVVALADGSMAAANAVAALSAASDGYEAKQQALVTRLTQLEQSVTQRRARRAAQDGADCGGLSGPSGSAISPAQQQLREETDDLTCIVEDMVSQVNCTVRPRFPNHAVMRTPLRLAPRFCMPVWFIR